MKDVEEFHPKNQKEWRNWLEENHVIEDAVWVIFYRKKSPEHNMGWSESVDEAGIPTNFVTIFIKPLY